MGAHSGSLAAQMRETPALKTGAPIRQLGGDDGENSNAADDRKRGSTTEQSASPVDVHAPWAGPNERAMRQRIHKALTISLARAAREEHGDARALYWHAGQIASAWVFRRVDDQGQLERVLWGLNQLFLAADHFRQADSVYVG